MESILAALEEAEISVRGDGIIVEAAKPLRGKPGPGEHSLVNAFNAHMLALFAEQPSAAAH